MSMNKVIENTYQPILHNIYKVSTVIREYEDGVECKSEVVYEMTMNIWSWIMQPFLQHNAEKKPWELRKNFRIECIIE